MVSTPTGLNLDPWHFITCNPLSSLSCLYISTVSIWNTVAYKITKIGTHKQKKVLRWGWSLSRFSLTATLQELATSSSFVDSSNSAARSSVSLYCDITLAISHLYSTTTNTRLLFMPCQQATATSELDGSCASVSCWRAVVHLLAPRPSLNPALKLLWSNHS